MTDIRQWISEQGWDWKEKNRSSSGLIAEMTCPFCHSKEKSFAISLKDGAFNCFRLNNCGVKGSFVDLQRMLGHQNIIYLNHDNNIMRQPVKYDKPKVKSEKNNKAIEWLKNRGIWEATSQAYRIGQQGSEIMFQYFKNGELVNVKYRSMNDKKFRQEKNAEPVLFGRDFCKDKEYVVICEGEIDCLSWSQYGYNVVSIPSGASDFERWLGNEWDFLNEFQKIYINFDNDEAGQKNIDEIVSRLGKWKCYNVVLPFKDMNECLMKDVSEEKIKECIENAKEYDPETLLKPIDFYDKIVEYNENPERRFGTHTPWKGLTKLLKGWRDCELTIWSGNTSSGKTTALNDVILTDIKNGIKTIVASLEMPPMKYLNWMIMRDRQKSSFTREEIRESLQGFENLFIVNFEGQVNQSYLFEIFEYAARKYGVKRIIIDSLMKIEIKGVDKYEEQKNFVNSIIENINKKFNAHTHLVAHPRKGMSDSHTPGRVDISGSGDIANLADNIIVMYRVEDDMKKDNTKKFGISGDNILYLKKNREHGDIGEIDLSFDTNTKTFTEI